MTTVEKAKITDVPEIHHLVNKFAGKGEMLARPLSEIYENLRDYFVVRGRNRKVIGCVALHISWLDLAEVKALAVAPSRQKKGIGADLVKACLDDAEVLGIPIVFCLTYKPEFFKKQGFNEVDKATLPRKIWRECFDCPKFPDCGEVALVYTLEEGAKLG